MSTGVRILPRDSVGYLYDGMPCTYRTIRCWQEYCAGKYPATKDHLASEARAINATHLRRLLAAATRGKNDNPYWVAAMPRALRRAWQRSGILESKMSVAATDEYVLKMDHQRRSIARFCAQFAKRPT